MAIYLYTLKFTMLFSVGGGATCIKKRAGTEDSRGRHREGPCGGGRCLVDRLVHVLMYQLLYFHVF